MVNRARLIIIAALLVIIGTVSAALFLRSHSFKGEGTIDSPYMIKSGRDLKALANAISSGDSLEGKFYALESDIDVSGESIIFPLGARDNEEPVEFKGVFDGRGYSICGVNVKKNGDAGFFASLSGMVCNLTMEYGTFEGTGNVGAFAARVKPEGRIINCCTYANAIGETAGAISGYTEGTLVNCLVILDMDEEPGVQNLTGTDELAHDSNCYVYDGENFELFVHGSADNQEKTYKRAVNNLNSRLFELGLDENNPTMYNWAYRDEYPNVYITESTADTIVEVVLTRADGSFAAASYDDKIHMWAAAPGENAYPLTITYTTKEGNSGFIVCETEADEVYFEEDGIGCGLRLFAATEKFTGITSNTDGQIAINLSEDITDTPGIYSVIQQYFGDDDELDLVQKQVYITKNGDYVLSGNLNGEVIFDIEGEDPALISTSPQRTLSSEDELRITLDSVSINSAYAPSILVVNAPEGKKKDPKVKVFLADNTENFLIGSNTMDIYSEDYYKDEGVFSSHVTTGFYGDTGSLYLKGDLEGIEVKSDCVMDGGSYNIDGVTDDGFSISELLHIKSGVIRAEAYDNVLDCEDVKLEGGKLIVVGPTPNENCLKDNVKLKGVRMAVGFTRNKDMSDKSTQNFIVAKFKDMIEADNIVLLTDENDKPLMAYRLSKPVKMVGFTAPEFKNGVYHFYMCSSVNGNWTYEMCEDITDYEAIRQLEIDGNGALQVSQIDNRFEFKE